VSKTLSISIPHRLTQDEARTRIQKGVAELREKHAKQLGNVTEAWEGNHCEFALSVMGQSIKGRADVLSDAVKLEVDLPWLVAAFAEKFRPTIEAEGRKMLEKK